MNMDETASAAACRELREETGLEVEEGALAWLGVVHRRSDSNRIDFFLAAERFAGEPAILEPHKCDRLEWHAPGALPEHMVDYVRAALAAILPPSLNNRFNFRVGQYFTVFLSLCAVMAFVLGVVYMQESLTAPPDALRGPFVKVFSLLALLAAVWAWWLVLANESRRMAHDESERQTQLLQKEIDAHQRTDAALQSAKEVAENASQAKTRYVAGMTHELRSRICE